MLYSRYWRSIFVPNDRLPIEKRLHKRPIAFSYQNLLWRAFHFSTRSIGWRRNDWSERPVWKFCGNAIGRQELSGYRSRHRHHAHGQINCGCPAQWQVTFNPPPSYINAPHPSNPFWIDAFCCCFSIAVNEILFGRKNFENSSTTTLNCKYVF